MSLREYGVDPENRDDLLMALPRLLILAGDVSARAGEALIFEPYGLSIAKYSLLMSLRRCGQSISMTQLRDSTFVFRSSSNFTQMVDDLEGRGLVRRLPSREDRRVSLVELTEAGAALADQVSNHYQALMREGLKEYPTEELQTALRVIARWINDSADAAGMAALRPQVHNSRPSAG